MSFLLGAALLVSTASTDPRLSAAHAALRKELAPFGGELTLRALDLGGAEEGVTHVRVGPITGPLPRSRVAIPVQWRDRSGAEKRAVAWFSVALEVEVPVWTRDLSKGETFETTMVGSDRVDLARFGGAPLADADDVQGLRLKKSVQEGRPVFEGDLEPRPTVAADQTLELKLNRSGIRLSVPAVAQTEGDPGDVIRVLAEGAERPVKARVLSASEVELAY